ncbi:MAG: CoA transferase, partial [Brevibacterium aurantiacum]
KIFRVEDMLSDPQYKARRSVVEVESKEYGAVTMQNAFPRLSRTDTAVRWVGPELGQDTDEVLTEVGYDHDALTDMRDKGVIR